jgi:hypothetical protein
VDLLGVVYRVISGEYYPLALLPEHDASYLCLVRTSENDPFTLFGE